MSFATYTDETGASVSQPTIHEVGGGAYYFTPVFPSASHGITYVLTCGTSTNVTPTHIARYMRPEDYYTDNIQMLINIETGKWQVYTTGPNANQLILYAPDGVTVIQKFNLLDSSGNPTFSSPFQRIPTS